MFTVLFALAVTLSPMDTPIEPVPVDEVESVITENAEYICELYVPAYSELSLALGGLESEEVITDMIDSYLVWSFERGAGDEYRLTPEAREVFVDYMHSCL